MQTQIAGTIWAQLSLEQQARLIAILVQILLQYWEAQNKEGDHEQQGA